MPKMPSGTPDHLPLLSRGAHRSVDDGACLMEYVSALAGEGFSDQPRCTDPVLAAVARQVNDHVSDAARPQLALLAPDLAGLRRIDPYRIAAVAAHCARIGLQVDHGNRWLLRMLRRAERMLERPRPVTPRGRMRLALVNSAGGLRTFIPLATRHLILHVGMDREAHEDPGQDARLVLLLRGCLQAARGEHDRAPPPVPPRAALFDHTTD